MRFIIKNQEIEFKLPERDPDEDIQGNQMKAA